MCANGLSNRTAYVLTNSCPDTFAHSAPNIRTIVCANSAANIWSPNKPNFSTNGNSNDSTFGDTHSTNLGADKSSDGLADCRPYTRANGSTHGTTYSIANRDTHSFTDGSTDVFVASYGLFRVRVDMVDTTERIGRCIRV